MQITLKSATLSADLQGRPDTQWELRCADPFSMKSEYETKYWIPAKERERPPGAATYWVILTQHDLKVNIKPPKDGGPIQPYNGFYDWMWKWRIDSRDHFNCPDATEPEFQQNVVSPAPMAPAGAVNGTGMPYVPPANPTTSERQSVFNAAASLIVATDLVDQSPEVILGRIASITGVRPEYATDLWTILQHIGSEAPAPTENVEVEEFDEEPLPWS